MKWIRYGFLSDFFLFLLKLMTIESEFFRTIWSLNCYMSDIICKLSNFFQYNIVDE